jgi:hypothetical protein
MYTTGPIMSEKPQVAGWLNYVLNNVNDLIGDVGYFPASTQSINESKQKWTSAVEEGTLETLGVDPANLPEVTIDAILVSEGATAGDAAEAMEGGEGN